MTLLFIATNRQSKFLPPEIQKSIAPVIIKNHIETKNAIFNLHPTMMIPEEGELPLPIVNVYTTGQYKLHGELWDDSKNQLIAALLHNEFKMYDEIKEFELEDGSFASMFITHTKEDWSNVLSLGVRYRHNTCFFERFLNVSK